jgi:hypothetical protein
MVYLIEQIQMVCAIDVSPNPIAQIVKKMPGLKTVKEILMEKTRAVADENAIDAHSESISRLFPGISRAFLVNSDESGFANSTDQRPESVMVLADYSLDRIYLPADGSLDRSTLVAAIAADGIDLKPLMIVPRLTIERALDFRGSEVMTVRFKYQYHGSIMIQPLKNESTKCECLTMPSSESS